MATPVEGSFTNVHPRVIVGPSSGLVDPNLSKAIGDLYVPNDGAGSAYWNSASWVSAGSGLSIFYFTTYNSAVPTRKYVGNGTISTTPLLQPLGQAGVVSQITMFIQSNTLNADAFLRIFKDGVDTGQKLDVPKDTVDLIFTPVGAVFLSTSLVDLVLDSAANAGTIKFSANVMF